METQTIFEIIGYLASGLVAVSLAMKRILYLRIVNLLGAITFVIYGLFIEAYPVVVVNAIIVLINLYYLSRLFGTSEYFRLLEVAPDSRYLRDFLDFYQDDIRRFAPDFAYQQESTDLVLLVLRNMLPSGVFIGHQNGSQFIIDLDYVTADYRDFKSGQHIYRDSRQAFTQRGIDTLVTTAQVPAQRRYLERIGFQPLPDQPERYFLPL